MCPVEQLDHPCPDQPFAATVVVRTPDGMALCTTRSGADGQFRIGLPPGSYVLDPSTGTGGSLPFARAQPVTVEPDRYTAVTIVFDTGIR
jgi:hypothetical protein